MKLINRIRNIILLIAVVLMMVPGDVIKALDNTITTVAPNNVSTAYIGQTYFAQKKLSDDSYAYCLNHNLSTPSAGLTYTKKNNITDEYPGIIYILQNGFPNKKKASKYLTGNTNKDYYITQAAIHWYIDRKNGISDTVAQGTYSYQQLGSGFKKTGQDKYGMRRYVKALVEDAIAATKTTDYNASVSINLTNESDIMTLDSERENWVSKEFSVSTNGNTSGTYTVSLTGAPTGTTITDVNGNTKTSFNEDENFLVKVPTASVTETSLNFNVVVSTSGNVINAYRYTTTNKNYQDIVVMETTEPDASDTYELNITNETTVPVKMAKIGENNPNVYIAGAKLKYSGTTSSNKTVNGTFTSKTSPTTINLRTGSYCLSEVTPPSRYLITTSKICFDIDGAGHILDHDTQNELGDSVVIKLNNSLNSVGIKKVNKDGNSLSGSKLALYKVESSSSDEEDDSSVQIGDDWTSGSNPQPFTGLEKGWYAVIEKKAPDTYAKAAPVYFYVNSNGQIVNEQGNIVTLISIENEKTVTNVHKTDITGTNEIPGAHLRVLDSNGDVVGEPWTSGTEPHEITGLVAGHTYILEETIAPTGYALTSSVEFTVNEDGSITEVTMKNDIIRLTISKQDITNGKELPGAHLVIRKENGDIYKEWDSSDEEYIIEMIPAGKYTLEETIAPPGYALNTEVITFVINEYGTITDEYGETREKLIMYNTPETPVPKTAANISVFVYLIGIIAVSGGAYLLYNKKKLNK